MKRRLALISLVLFPALALCEPAKETEKPAPAAAAKVSKVKFKTTEGDIVLELNAEKAPITVANFLSYVKKKHYDGTVFHRVLPTFMIQGGGFEIKSGALEEKPVGSPIKNEGQNGLSNTRGTIAMARTPVLDSATSQFFISVVDNSKTLDYPANGGYAVFGKVIEGMDVVDKIKSGKTTVDPRGEPSLPAAPVTITTATVIE